MLAAKAKEVAATLVLVVLILVAMVEETLAILVASVLERATAKSLTDVILVLAVPMEVARVEERATAKSLTDVILVLAVLILVAMVEETFAILVARAAEVAARTVLTDVMAALLTDVKALTAAISLELGIALPPINILVVAKRLAADTSPENSAAAPDTLEMKLPVDAMTEDILRLGFTFT